MVSEETAPPVVAGIVVAACPLEPVPPGTDDPGAPFVADPDGPSATAGVGVAVVATVATEWQSPHPRMISVTSQQAITSDLLCREGREAYVHHVVRRGTTRRLAGWNFVVGFDRLEHVVFVRKRRNPTFRRRESDCIDVPERDPALLASRRRGRRTSRRIVVNEVVLVVFHVVIALAPVVAVRDLADRRPPLFVAK